MLSLLVALTLIAPQDPDPREAYCVEDALASAHGLNAKDATAACEAKFGWSPTEAYIAYQVAFTNWGIGKMRALCQAQGVDLSRFDAAFATLSADDIAEFGWKPNGARPPEDLVDRVLAIADIDSNKGNRELVSLTARARNAIAAFKQARGYPAD